MGKGTVFAWQHDARHQGHNRITIFDDGAQPQVEPQSRGLVIELDPKTQSARLVRKYVHRPNKIVSRFMGNMQALDNGNVMIGWGSEPYFTEFGPNGEIEFDARLPDGGQNYRAFRLPWHGRPSLPPAAVYRFAHGQGTVYASWNGATEVAAWRLDAGPRPGRASRRQRRCAARLRDRAPHDARRQVRAGSGARRGRAYARPLEDDPHLDRRPQQPERRHADGDRERELTCPPGGDPGERRGGDPDPAFPARALSDGVTSAANTAIGTKCRKRSQNGGSRIRTSRPASRDPNVTASIPAHVAQKLIARATPRGARRRLRRRGPARRPAAPWRGARRLRRPRRRLRRRPAAGAAAPGSR